eukprot:803225_1
MTLFFLFYTIWNVHIHGWTTSNILLPTADSAQAVGFYNDSFYILGGVINGNQMTQYNTAQNEMITLPSLSVSVIGDSQFYSTLNDILYMIHRSGDSFSSYDLKTNTFIANWNNMTPPVTTHGPACVQTMTGYLFVVGGGDGSGPYSSALQIYSFGNNSWFINTPSMNIKRGRLTCIIHPSNNKLYALSGSSDSTWYEASIEAINVSQMDAIQSESWVTLSSQLLIGVYSPRSVIHDTSIIVIGGYRGSYIALNQVVDVVTEQVSDGGSLNYGAEAAATIMVGNVVYVFGGTSDYGNKVNTWQYLVLPTSAPSEPPTQSPSSHTYSPSALPSQSPTRRSSAPSLTPSLAPSLFPSLEPSLAPSLMPSVSPSLAPTKPPSVMRSISPSTAPSWTPSLTTSLTPTQPPTTVPSIAPSLLLSHAPTTAFPTNAPTFKTGLWFVCWYTDLQWTEYTRFMSLVQYAQLMVNATLRAVESITYDSTNYKHSQWNGFAPWRRSGFVDFDICSVFDTSLSNDCPSYEVESSSSEDETQSDYIAIGTFAIVTDEAIQTYLNEMIDVMESKKFARLFSHNMNALLDGVLGEYMNRRVLIGDVFQAIKVVIMDPTSTGSTADSGDEKQREQGSVANKSGSDTTTVLLIIVSVLLLVAVTSIAGMLIYYKKDPKQNDGEEQNKGDIKNDCYDGDRDIIEGVNQTQLQKAFGIANDDENIVNEINQTNV